LSSTADTPTRRPVARWLFVALVLFTLVKGFVWVSVIPTWETPDEEQHVAYAEDVARTGDLWIQPRHGSVALDKHLYATEHGWIAQRPGYNGTWHPQEVEEREHEIASISDRDRREPGHIESTASTYGPAYYWMAAAVLKGTQWLSYEASLNALRLVSVAMMTLTLVLQLATFRLVFVDPWRPLLAGAIVTLLPMYSFAQMAPNPDTLVTLVGAAALLCLVRVVVDGGGWRSHAVIGIILAVGMLTKPNAAVFVLIYALVMAVMFARGGQVRRSRTVIHGAVAAAVLVLLAGWWMVGQPANPGGGRVAYAPAEIGFGRAALESFYLHLQTEWHLRFVELFWGTFGWTDTPLGAGYVTTLSVVTTAALVGLLIAIANGRGRNGPLWVLAATFAVLVGMLVWVEYQAWTGGQGGFVQGRYMFPAIGGFVAIVVAGLTEPFRGPRMPRVAIGAAVLGLGFVHVMAIAQFILPRFYL
jgi:4-amino-4-deoxy-L-arabinose transferase-like glycosyltransferase